MKKYRVSRRAKK